MSESKKIENSLRKIIDSLSKEDRLTSLIMELNTPLMRRKLSDEQYYLVRSVAKDMGIKGPLEE